MEINPKNGYYSLGLQTCEVPMKLFDENRKRLAAALRDNPSTPQDSVVLLQAGGEQGKYVFGLLIEIRALLSTGIVKYIVEYVLA
jgi:hypothetical protein